MFRYGELRKERAVQARAQRVQVQNKGRSPENGSNLRFTPCTTLGKGFFKYF